MTHEQFLAEMAAAQARWRCHIYRVVHIETGKTYVGKTSGRPNTRWLAHKRSGRTVHGNGDWQLRHAMSKHGVDAFRFEVIEDVIGKAAMDARERHWIVELGTLWPHGYNYNLPGGREPGPMNDAEPARLRRQQDDRLEAG